MDGGCSCCTVVILVSNCRIRVKLLERGVMEALEIKGRTRPRQMDEPQDQMYKQENGQMAI